MPVNCDPFKPIVINNMVNRSPLINIPIFALIILGLITFGSTWAEAYVGPGAGITAIGALWAVIATVFITLGGLLIWPIRSFLRRKKRKSENESDATSKPAEVSNDE
jgi:membrane protein implicated in regulation of membrane protease activity